MFTRLTHGLGAMALVTLTSGVLVYSAGPAQADTTLIQEAELFLQEAAGGGEGLAMASPEVAAAGVAICSTGVGCAVVAGTVAVGIGLYLTRDTWQPYLAQQWGQTALGGSWSYGDGFRLKVRDDLSSGSGLVLDVEALNTWGPLFMPVNVSGTSFCSGGAHTSDIGINVSDANGGRSGMYFRDNVGLPFTSPALLDCPNLGTLQGFRGTANGGLADSLSWGTGVVAPTSTRNTALTVNCQNPDGSSYQVTGPPTITGPGTPVPNNGVIQPTCTGAPGSQVGAHGKCVTLKGSLVPGDPLSDLSSTCPGVDAAQRAADIKYPSCVGGGVACTYVVRVNGLPCSIGGTGCVDWPAQAEVAPQNYECFYGPYSVPLAACNALERAYESGNRVGTTVGTIPATGPNTDGDPRTFSLPAPLIPPPTTARVPAPTTVATDPNAPKPCTSGQACNVAPTSGQDCFPSGFGSFNPASWVLQPIKCALSWAFVPSAVFMNGWGDGIKGEWASSPFGQWLAPLSGFGTLHIASGGCEGPALPTGFLGEGLSNGAFHVASPAVLPAVLHPFSACADPMAGVARTSNMILTAGIAFYGGMKVIRQLGYAFGFQIHVGSERSTFT